MRDTTITPDLLLHAYAAGIFPMADSADAPELFWVDPTHRGILPVEGFHLSRSLARRLRRGSFTASFDTCFAEVVTACADRPETWINDEIFWLYDELHAMGYGHSVEVWEEGRLVGGAYGVALGGAFFGESMFSRTTDASKAALAWLIDLMRRGGFTLLDVQFLTEHLQSLGAIEIPRADYRRRLSAALERTGTLPPPGDLPPGHEVAQRITQTS